MVRPAAAEVLESLARPDKWYLGGGGPLLWAPPFPQFLGRPGCWDRAHYYGFALAPVFALALLAGDGREIPLLAAGRDWRPDRLLQHYTGSDVELLERRAVTPQGALVSRLRLRNLAAHPQRLSVVLWTAQPGPITAHGTDHLAPRRLEHPRVPPLEVWLAFGMAPPPQAAAIRASEPVPSLPRWDLTPFAGLGLDADGWRAREAAPAAMMFAAQRVDLELAGHAAAKVVAAAGVGLSPAAALARLGAARTAPPGDEGDPTRAAWERFLQRAPAFRCSDPYLERAYWYRWYTVFLNTIEAPEGAYRHPFVCEGIDYFRAPISYSAPALLRELRWLDRPELAQGLVRTFLDHQRDDGSLPGHVFATGVRPESFYHANWGAALRALGQIHPDPAFVAEVYPAFERYAEWLHRTRDPDDTGLIDVWNQFETGQEYSPRYAFAQPDAGDAGWGQVFRLKGVDVTVYAYQLSRWLADAAPRPERRAVWNARARRTGAALLERCWDEARGFFVDVLPGALARSPVRAATGLYPFATDLVSAQHLRALWEHLLDPASFWTPVPVPTVSLDDPLFSPDGVWREVRRNCPWNGRVWPMVNSHVVEALVYAAERLDSALLPRAAELLQRFVRTLFWDADPARPNCFEHYHPFTGTPSAFRGIDDYLHSWLVDLIVQYACGLRSDDPAHVVVRPLPLGLEAFELDDAPLRSRRVSLRWSAPDGLRLFLDGRQVAARPDLGPLAVALDAR